MRYTRLTSILPGVFALTGAVVLPVTAAFGAMGCTKLKGVCEYTLLRPVQPFYSQRCSFEVSATGGSWVICYEDLAAATNQDLLNVRAVASCDGRNIYFVQFQSEGGNRNAWGAKYESVKGSLPTAIATIYPGTYPPPEQPMLQRLWFALASASVLHPPAGRLKPLECVDLAIFYNNRDFSWDYHVRTDPSLPGQRSMFLTNSGNFIVRDHATGRVSRLRCAPPYDRGFLAGLGVWRDSTDDAGVAVPAEFEYTGFDPKYSSGGGPSELVPGVRYACVVTNTESATIDKLPVPLPAGRVLVIDRRLAKRGWAHLDYVTTNGWLAAEDPFVAFRARNSPRVSLEEEVLGALGLKVAHANGLRNCIWVLFALPLGALACRGLLNKLRQDDKRKAT